MGLLALLAIWALVMCSAVAVIIIPAASPAAGAQVADLLRSIVGVQPVADLESFSNRLRDDLNRYRFLGTQSAPQISLSGAATPTSAPPAAPASPTPAPTAAAAKSVPSAPQTDVVTAPPALSWQPYGQSEGNTPLMARTLVLVDAQRSYAGVALVRIDLSRLQLHMMPGTLEPAHPSGIGQAIPSLGTVPPSDQPVLVAAFNGGFKAVHGHYGMMVNGITLLPPIDGMGTVAIYQDGSVQIGSWNQDLMPSPDMIAYRQNCPPLIDAGQLNPLLGTDASRAWGFTHNNDITWRTGLGLTQDRHYLIYAVGNGTDALFLARALQQAGAYWAMQLDINQYYAHFLTYTQSNGALVGQRLVDQMVDRPQMFITPDLRDFFYLTVR